MDDERKPWDRLPGEPELWFRRFREYLAQELPRSLTGLYRSYCEKRGKNRRGKKPPQLIEVFPHSWGDARDEYHWLERAAAYDREQTEQQLREKEKLRRAHEEREAEGSLLMHQKAAEMIALPTIVREEEAIGENGVPQKITMMPGSPKHFTAAARLFAQSSINGRLALGMPTHVSFTQKEDLTKQKSNVLGVIIIEDNGRRDPLPPLEFTEAEVEEIRSEYQRQIGAVELPEKDPVPHD